MVKHKAGAAGTSTRLGIGRIQSRGSNAAFLCIACHRINHPTLPRHYEEPPTPIWVDADACPSEIKQLLFRAAERTKTKVTLVANQPLRTPRSEFVESLLVLAGTNVADQRIVELVEPGDLVITADIPLAAAVVGQGGQAFDPRGEFYTETNVGQRLAARNLMDDLRGGGQVTRGPAAFTTKDRQAFANQLDRWLTAAKK